MFPKCCLRDGFRGFEILILWAGMDVSSIPATDNDDTAVVGIHFDNVAATEVVKAPIKRGTVLSTSSKVERRSPPKELNDEEKAKLDAQRLFESKLVKNETISTDEVIAKEENTEPADRLKTKTPEDDNNRDNEDDTKNTTKERACDSILNEEQKNDQENPENRDNDLVNDKRIVSVNIDQGTDKELKDSETNDNPKQIESDPNMSRENLAPNMQVILLQMS